MAPFLSLRISLRHGDPEAADGLRPMFLVVAAVLAWALVGVYLTRWGTHWAVDLRVYRAAVSSLFHHRSPYLMRFTSDRLPFTYPPFALLALSPLAVGSLSVAMALWWLVNELALIGVLFVALTRALRISRRHALLAATIGGAIATLVFEPLRSNLDYANINLLLMALVVADLLAVKGRGRGVMVGIAAAIKLTPLVFLAYFVVSGDRRSAIRGIASFAGVTALSWVLLPAQSARFWFHEAFDFGRPGKVAALSNQSWNGVLHRAMPHARTADTVVWAALALLTAAIGVIAARRLVTLERPVEAVLALALTEVLISPISWSHHWSWLVLAGVVLPARWLHDRVTSVALIALLAMAALAPYGWGVGGWPGAVFGDSLTIAGAALLAVMAMRSGTGLSLPRSPSPLPRAQRAGAHGTDRVSVGN